MACPGNPAQNPQNVADAVVKIIEIPASQRPFRTIVDKMGMGDAIQPYNEQLEKLSSGLYSAFGIGQMRHKGTAAVLLRGPFYVTGASAARGAPLTENAGSDTFQV
jgi:hypothetical protein